MDAETPLVPATLASLHWLVGNWSGSINSDPVEENWSPEQGGQMMMNFRWLREGKPRIYEFGILGVWDDHIEMRLRHLRSTGASVEAQNANTVFRLLRIEGQRAVFEEVGKNPAPRLLYERTENDLKVWFEVDSGDPPVTGVFAYSLRN